jgi:hypothetical protein
MLAIRFVMVCNRLAQAASVDPAHKRQFRGIPNRAAEREPMILNNEKSSFALSSSPFNFLFGQSSSIQAVVYVSAERKVYSEYMLVFVASFYYDPVQ